jgi:uncharacterized LabA/DUF88 family protein
MLTPNTVVGLFVDVGDLYFCTGKRFNKRKMDYRKYLELACGDSSIFTANAYGIQEVERAQSFITSLKHYGFTPIYKDPRYTLGKDESGADVKTIKYSSWHVGITMDVVRSIDKLDVVILGSANIELLPLVQWIGERGRKCHIVACGISKELRKAATHFVEIPEDIFEP